MGWLTTACTSNSASGDAAASRSASSADATSGCRGTRRRRATEAGERGGGGSAPDARGDGAAAVRGDGGETASRAVARVDDDETSTIRVRKIWPRLAADAPAAAAA